MAPTDARRHLGIDRHVVRVHWAVQQHLADHTGGSSVRWHGRNAVHDPYLLAGPLPDTHHRHSGRRRDQGVSAIKSRDLTVDLMGWPFVC